MLRPSYSELMDVLNNGSSMDSKITSRYTIVIAASKRARQIIDGANPLTYAPSDKAVSIAVKEMNEGKILVKLDEDLLSRGYEESLFDSNYFARAVSEPIKDKYNEVGYDDDDFDDAYDDKDYDDKDYDEKGTYEEGYDADDYEEEAYDDIAFEDEDYDMDEDDEYEEEYEDDVDKEDLDES